MSDRTTLPSVDPPPYPAGYQTPNPSPVESVQPSPPANFPQSNIPNQPANIPPQSPSYPKLPKKGIPKVAIYILIGMFAVIGVLLLFLFVRRGGSGSLIGTEGELTWWGVSNEQEVIQPLIDEFQSQNPNVRIIYIKQSQQDYRERLTNALASGQGPDIFEIHNSWGSMFKNDFSNAPSGVMTKEEFNNAFYPVASLDLVNETGIIGIPLEYDALTLYINEDIFTSALKTPPKTWNELSILAKELTQVGANRLIIQSGVSLGLTENVDHWQEIIALMMLQNGASLQKPEAAVTKDAVSFYTNFSKKDPVWDSTLPRSTDAFARSKLAMYFAPSTKIKEIVNENSNLRFRTVPLPQLPKERPTDPDISYATYWAQSVWKRSKNTEVAWAFLKYLSSVDGLQKLNQNRKNLNIQEKIYPRKEMDILQKNDEVLGSIVLLAPVAKSWYLADETFDGQTGINSQINTVYEEVVNTVLDSRDVDKVIAAFPGKLNEIVTKYTSTQKR